MQHLFVTSASVAYQLKKKKIAMAIEKHRQ